MVICYGYFNNVTKEEILELFRGLKSKRLFSSELDRIIAPAKGARVSMNLSFDSARPAIGRQIDSLYDNGYKAECSIDGEELEFIVLFRKEDSDFVESLGPGEDFEIPVQVLAYDALYHKPTLGALLKSNSDPKTPSKGTPEVQNPYEQQHLRESFFPFQLRDRHPWSSRTLQDYHGTVTTLGPPL